MILGIGTEGSVFLYAGLAGVSVLCAYYALVCFRKLIPHRLIAVGIEDVIFWVVASVYIFRRMYDTTYGSIRWFFMLGILCGAGTAYLVFRLCSKIYAKVKKSLEKYKKTR
ncbi:MAG TPA: spore cortex biosynthesis protein YabQ [Candidatus Mediterraneibacter ornithocaccae]|nr:spore cortex biosynthesis protein YabQ [Candidatus Mediterraneibacter ornithocaccae]